MLYVLVYLDLSLIILEELEIYYYVFEDQEMFYCSKKSVSFIILNCFHWTEIYTFLISKLCLTLV